MKSWFSISLMILAGFTLQSCGPANPQNSSIASGADTPQTYVPTPPQTPEKVEFKRGKVDFKGVRFTYDPRIFTDVRGEEILDDSPVEMETDKPGENFPKHIVFYLQYRGREATIRIIPILEYRRMVSVSENLTRIFDEELEGIRRASVDEKFRINRVEKEMPFIPFYDAGQEFQNKVKRLSFQNGKGFFFLTEWTIEPTIINNERLDYFFQGTTSDESKYVLAEFPVSAEFLPNKDSLRQFEGYELYDDFYRRKSSEKEHTIYVTKIAQRLERLPENKFQPDLKYFQEIISSLKVEAD